MDKNKGFQELFSKLKEAFPERTPAAIQKEATLFWNSIKGDKDFPNKLNTKYLELSNIARVNKAKLLSFWSRVSIVLEYTFYKN